MTSAALADCNGAISDSTSKANTRRTGFMKVAPSSKVMASARSGYQHYGAIKYRLRMKDLRRAVFAVPQGCGCPQRQRHSARHHRGCLDLDPCGLFNETHDLDQCHRGIMRTENVAIDLSKRLQVRQIFFHIDDIPGETNEMFGPRAARGKNL